MVRNTGLLYVRLIFLTLINLYTVRITLEALGDVDYGVFEVIASVVTSLSVLSGAMSSASQRFLAFNLGRSDYENYSHTFTLLLGIFGVIAVVMVMIGEAIGIFFIDDWLNIPPDRLFAAHWVYQTSLLSFAVGLMTIPYTASIVANERMDAFALFSIVEGALKLVIAWILVIYGGDRLILYGILMAITGIVVLLMSMGYCHSKFRYCRYVWKWDRSIISELSKYTGWNLFGSVSAMLANQGQNILLNIYFGPVINASKAIADRIRQVVSGFSINLYMAASPQIIKFYASNDYDRAMNLVLRTSKFAFLLIFVLAFPLICNMKGLLTIWLGSYSHTEDICAFSILVLLYCMLLALEPPISRIIQATGEIRTYQMSVGIITLSYLPIAALTLALGGTATMTLKVLIAVMTVAHMVRVIVAHRQVSLDYGRYLRAVVIPIARVGIVAVPVYMLFDHYQAGQNLWKIIIDTLISGMFGLFIALFLGLDKEDRSVVYEFIRKKLNRK